MIPINAGPARIYDIADPQPEQIDLPWMWWKLGTMRRFNQDPNALTVLQHLALCRGIAIDLNQPWPVVQWAWRHDCHEAFIGDMIAPLKHHLKAAAAYSQQSDRLAAVERAFDEAILRAERINPPSNHTRQIVHRIDRIALRMEMNRMRIEPDSDLPSIPNHLNQTRLIEKCLTATAKRPA